MTTRYRSHFLTTKEVAEFLHINEKMVYMLVNDKDLPGSKITGKWLFPRRLVEEWVEINIDNYQSKNKKFDESLLLVAGSDDPLFQSTLNLFQNSYPGKSAFFSNMGSMGGISALRRGICHIGVCHLLQNDQEEYNFNFAEKELDKTPIFLNFSRREQGLLVPKGNPKNIEGIEDLIRGDIKIVNRPLTTGTRLLLDHELAKLEISNRLVTGYNNEVSRHLDAGLEVLSGRVDTAPGIKSVAGLLGLDFVPLRWERFDLVINKERFFERIVQDFISMLHEESFRQLAGSYVGYDVSLCGKMLFPDNLKQRSNEL
ncbi:MAG: helix-turn-helix transcriptional regulator [Desulfotalea sp.]